MKKTVTIAIIVVVALLFAYFLLKISPGAQTGGSGSAYNASLDASGVRQLSAVPPFDATSDRFAGDAKAKNIFIEYADFQCPACAAVSDMLKQVPAQFTDTVFVFRYFPLVQIHKNSVESALAAETAGAQGKYWEMHDILFQKQGDWESADDPLDLFAQYAQTVGVKDIGQFKNDITAKKYLAPIQKNYNEALGLSLPGTPSYFFNGHALQNSDFAGLKKQAEALYNK